jgi:hypothetical protein
MALDFSIIGDYVGEYFDTDEIDIGRMQLITLPDGTQTVIPDTEPLYTNVKCHISENTTPNPDPATAGTTPILVSLTINCPTSIDLQNADRITARRLAPDGSILAVYTGTIGVPMVNQARQEAIMVARKEE